MGDAAPPMLDARAIPNNKARDVEESGARLRKIG